MSEDRLTPLDASFLHLEDASSHMHVACVMVFDGDPPPYDEFVNRIERRLHLVPRYRQKLATVPLGQGRPRWVDDAGFDTRYHVRVTALPAPGGEPELQVLAGRVFSIPLNRDKPLWEMWLVEGLRGGRFAVLSKTHHALVDGVSGLDILSVVFAPDEAAAGAPQWQPRPAPSGAELLAEALWERATRPAEAIRPLRALARRPLEVTRAVAETVVGIGAMAWAGLQPAPRTPYNERTVGPDRRFVWVRGSLAEVKEIKNSLGGTVNDVILATVTRALRRHLIRRGEDVEGLTLKAFVPVSLRAQDERGELGNRVSGMVAPLPVFCSTPSRALAQITEAMGGLKDSGQAVGAQALTELTGFAPPNLLSQASRLITRQRFINLVVTNVPGPQQPLLLGDHQLLDIFPMVPLGTNLGLGVAIVSYHGTINFGLVGDFDIVPDLEDLAGDFTAALAELAEAAGVRSRSAEAGEGGGARDQQRLPADVSNGSRPKPARPTPNGRRSPGKEESVGDRGPASDAVEPDAPPPTDQARSDDDVSLVAESADPGAEDGVGAQLHVDAPWPGYDRMRAVEIVDRLTGAGDEVVAVVRLYEATHKNRRQVMSATEKGMRH